MKRAAQRVACLGLATLLLYAYSGATHDEIIDRAFAGLSRQQREILKRISSKEDEFSSGGQATSTSFRHAMRAPGQSADEAERLFANYVTFYVEEARSYQEPFERSGRAGMSDDALDSFGHALHAVTDSTSPLHAGFQLWDNNVVRMWLHARREAKVTPEDKKRAAQAARNVYQRTFGDVRLREATGGSVQPVAPARPKSDNK